MYFNDYERSVISDTAKKLKIYSSLEPHCYYERYWQLEIITTLKPVIDMILLKYKGNTDIIERDKIE
jgi:hypothetical protein